jgi:transcription initiation factor TFIID subunit 8
MLNARRSQPTPMDFKYALAQFSLPIASLEPHLKPPVSASKYHLQLEPQLPDELNAASVAVLLGKDLSGEPDKRTKPYIPKRFPSFPSKHTYKWSEKESTREIDPRKIREAASKEARQAEEGLRKFTQVNKGGREKELKKTASKDPTSKTRHELWEGTMGELEFTMNGLLPAAGGSDRGLIVNADSKYLRKGASAKKKSPTMHA